MRALTGRTACGDHSRSPPSRAADSKTARSGCCAAATAGPSPRLGRPRGRRGGRRDRERRQGRRNDQFADWPRSSDMTARRLGEDLEASWLLSSPAPGVMLPAMRRVLVVEATGYRGARLPPSCRRRPPGCGAGGRPAGPSAAQGGELRPSRSSTCSAGHGRSRALRGPPVRRPYGQAPSGHHAHGRGDESTASWGSRSGGLLRRQAFQPRGAVARARALLRGSRRTTRPRLSCIVVRWRWTATVTPSAGRPRRSTSPAKEFAPPAALIEADGRVLSRQVPRERVGLQPRRRHPYDRRPRASSPGEAAGSGTPAHHRQGPCATVSPERWRIEGDGSPSFPRPAPGATRRTDSPNDHCPTW